MQHITSAAELKNAIQLLEVEQTFKAQLLKKQFQITYESLKPAHLIRSILKDITSSPYLIDNLVGTAIGLGSGYLSKKIVVGTSSNIIRNLLGSILQFGVTNVVSRHPDAIKTFGQYLFQRIFRTKEPINS